MKILYGTESITIDVTDICYNKLMRKNIIRIIKNDDIRGLLFTDPCFGKIKHIYTVQNNITTEHDNTDDIYINTTTNEVFNKDIPNYIKEIYSTNLDTYKEKLQHIHTQLKIGYGDFQDEYPEQLMTVTYLTGDEKVLEIGSNIGRNSLIIGHILSLKNNNNFVTMECDSDIGGILQYNRDINKMKFHIENAALSKRKLIQKGWNTICSDEVLEGYKSVNIISYEEIMNKYNIQFDTLILDCEGAFYYILMDMPEILNNVKLIIMENDYRDITHKEYVDNTLKKNGFYVDYAEEGVPLALELFPGSYNNFYEVWKKRV